MAMSLKALRPALWSTRFVCSSPPRLCVLPYHKQHLLKGCELSTVCYRHTLAHPSRAAVLVSPGTVHGYSTKASAQATNKNDSKKPAASLTLTQIKDSKTVEELLELIEQHSLSVDVASFALGRLVWHCHNTTEGWKTAQSKVVSDPRFVKLTKILLKNGASLGTRDKAKSLINCCRMDVRNKVAVIDVLVPELRQRMRSMDVLSLVYIVTNYNHFRDNKQTKDLVHETARVLQLRWREMDELAPKFYSRLLAISHPFSRDYKTFISDKVLESIDKFSFSELVQITGTLAGLPLRNKAILRAIAYQAIQLGDQWEMPLVYRLLESIAELRFHHQPLTQQIAEFVEKNKSQWTPSGVNSIARSFQLLRIPQPGLFDAISTYAQEHLEEFNIYPLSMLLFAFGDMSYQPKNKEDFDAKVMAKIRSAFKECTHFQRQNLAFSLMVCDQLPEFIMKEVLLPRNANDTDPADSNRQRFSDLLLMQINTHARLACPDYQGPYLESPALPENLIMHENSLQTSVWDILQKVLGDGNMVKTNMWTTLGYKIDALILMDASNKPVIVDDYQLPNISMEGSEYKKAIPEEFKRIAVLIWSPKHMMVDSETLIGRCNMLKRHVQLAGYKTVEVTFRQWNQAKTEYQKMSLIKFKLAEATLIK